MKDISCKNVMTILVIIGCSWMWEYRQSFYGIHVIDIDMDVIDKNDQILEGLIGIPSNI